MYKIFDYFLSRFLYNAKKGSRNMHDIIYSGKVYNKVFFVKCYVCLWSLLVNMSRVYGLTLPFIRCLLFTNLLFTLERFHEKNIRIAKFFNVSTRWIFYRHSDAFPLYGVFMSVYALCSGCVRVNFTLFININIATVLHSNVRSVLKILSNAVINVRALEITYVRFRRYFYMWRIINVLITCFDR